MSANMMTVAENAVKAIITKYGGIVNQDCWDEILLSFSSVGLDVLHGMGIHNPQN